MNNYFKQPILGTPGQKLTFADWERSFIAMVQIQGLWDTYDELTSQGGKQVAKTEVAEAKKIVNGQS